MLTSPLSTINCFDVLVAQREWSPPQAGRLHRRIQQTGPVLPLKKIEIILYKAQRAS